MLRALLVLLLLCDPVLAQTHSKADVRWVQRVLIIAGYEIDEIDGWAGGKTAAAIGFYQNDWQIEKNGDISEELISRLKGEHPDTRPRLQKAENQDCLIYNPRPGPRETVTYEGPCIDGKADGAGKAIWRWVLREQVQETTWIGDYQGGKLNGRGIATTPDGDRYEGWWLDSLEHGNGVFSSAQGDRIEGEFERGAPHGQAVFTAADGFRYEGEFRDGVIHGHGVATWPSGDHYEGEWKEDLFSGQGTLTWSDGSRYEGEWWRGKRHGDGVAIFTDGSRFEGEWQSDKPDGFGKFIAADGNKVSGEWRGKCTVVGRRGSSSWGKPRFCLPGNE